MFYQIYDLQHALLTPARLSAEFSHAAFTHPWNPISYTQLGRILAANSEVFERSTRRFGKPIFDLPYTKIDGKNVRIKEKIVLEKSFCHLMHFERSTKRKDPKVLVVAPMSGHFATLLRGTVEALLPHHDVYITDWMDARHVPTKEGRFNLDDYIAYVMEFIRFLGAETHVIAVCQPAVPVLAATALMESLNDPLHPRSITLMGGPIDPRVSKTEVTELAESRPLSWFENTVVTEVPFYYAGAYRSVYPGFLQLSGFMSMNLDRHVGSHIQFYNHLIDGDGESAEFHRKFYDEYMAVMDITAEFYLQTVETVFQRHLLPKGKMKWRDPETEILHDVDLTKIKKTAILTIEGENDDISAYGQTSATHALCENLKPTLKYHHFAENVGHYGIFNGRRWREQIMPRIRAFARSVDQTGGLDPVPATDIAAMKNPEKHNKMPEKWDAEKFSVKAIKAFSHAKKKALEKQQKQQEKSAEFTAEKTEREES